LDGGQRPAAGEQSITICFRVADGEIIDCGSAFLVAQSGGEACDILGVLGDRGGRKLGGSEQVLLPGGDGCLLESLTAGLAAESC